MGSKQIICGAAAVLLLGGQAGMAALAADVLPETTPRTAETALFAQTTASYTTNHYTEVLQDRTIAAGETLSYTTVSSEFAELPATEGIYPGELTVVIDGTVVVEKGGCLSIGTLSIGGQEAGPVLQWGPGAQIIVEAGGELKLTTVTFVGVQQTPVIRQMAGGSVDLQLTPVEDGWIAWSGPVVDNLDQRLEDLWLEVGTPLGAELLPTVWEVQLEEQGSTTWTELALYWDLTGAAGQTEGSCVVTGGFLDGAGTEVPSLRPLELTVHWYTPEQLVVTDAVWKGGEAATAQLTVAWLPEDVPVWGEVSTDNGKTWQRWTEEERFWIVTEASGGHVCVFALPDDTPRMFRLAAEDPVTHTYWRSASFALAPEEAEDSGGNRGGSTSPVTPNREPALPAPTASPAPTVTPAPAAEAAAPAPLVTAAPSMVTPAGTATPSPTPAPEKQTGADPATAEQAQTPMPSATPESGAASPAASQAVPLPAQVLLVAVGLAACAVLTLVLTRTGPFRRDR